MMKDAVFNFVMKFLKVKIYYLRSGMDA